MSRVRSDFILFMKRNHFLSLSSKSIGIFFNTIKFCYFYSNQHYIYVSVGLLQPLPVTGWTIRSYILFIYYRISKYIYIHLYFMYVIVVYYFFPLFDAMIKHMNKGLLFICCILYNSYIFFFCTILYDDKTYKIHIIYILYSSYILFFALLRVIIKHIKRPSQK